MQSYKECIDRIQGSSMSSDGNPTDDLNGLRVLDLSGPFRWCWTAVVFAVALVVLAVVLVIHAGQGARPTHGVVLENDPSRKKIIIHTPLPSQSTFLSTASPLHEAFGAQAGRQENDDFPEAFGSQDGREENDDFSQADVPVLQAATTSLAPFLPHGVSPMPNPQPVEFSPPSASTAPRPVPTPMPILSTTTSLALNAPMPAPVAAPQQAATPATMPRQPSYGEPVAAAVPSQSPSPAIRWTSTSATPISVLPGSPTDSEVVPVAPLPAGTPIPTPAGSQRRCLCVFDVDRTLTGKQGQALRCPGNEEQAGTTDGAYAGGTLVLSRLATGVQNTFCRDCYRSIVSSGFLTGEGSVERSRILGLLGGPAATLSASWSQRKPVTSPLVVGSLCKHRWLSAKHWQFLYWSARRPEAGHCSFGRCLVQGPQVG